MKNNKGFSSIIVLVIVGVLVVGGGAYYLGKSSNTTPLTTEENNYQPVDNTENTTPVQNPVTNNTTATVSLKCSPNFAKSLHIISPNGGESYHPGDVIHIKFESCVSIPTAGSFNGAGIFRYDLSGNYASSGGRIELVTGHYPAGDITTDYLKNYKQEKIGNIYIGTFDVQIPVNGYMTATLPKLATINVADLNFKYKLYLEGVFSENWDSSDSSDNFFTIQKASQTQNPITWKKSPKFSLFYQANFNSPSEYYRSGGVEIVYEPSSITLPEFSLVFNDGDTIITWGDYFRSAKGLCTEHDFSKFEYGISSMACVRGQETWIAHASARNGVTPEELKIFGDFVLKNK